jgi:hypothetical protein
MYISLTKQAEIMALFKEEQNFIQQEDMLFSYYDTNWKKNIKNWQKNAVLTTQC